MTVANFTLFDSHTHLDDARFDADRAAMLERAVAAGVADALLAGVTAARWPVLKAVCATPAPGMRLHASYGLHPMFIDEHRDEDLVSLEQWLEAEKPVAIGECGLDFQVDADPERQRRFFRQQVGLARETGLPLILHARRAVEEVIQTLRREGPVRGVVHSYGGSIEQARQLWDLGILVGLGGPLTHERARKLHRLVTDMPLQQLLLETDAPDQAGAMHRGERNEPAFLPEVLSAVAALRDESMVEIARIARANALNLFNLDPA